jgi:phosphatidate cytidylyltransferase
MANSSDLRVRTLSAIVMVAVAGTALWLGGWWWTVFACAVGLGVLWEWSTLARGIANTRGDAAMWAVAGVAYIGVAVWTLVMLRAMGLAAAVAPVAIVVAVDVGAYFAGRTFGGPKIAPKISPSKTWSGLIGGAVAAALLLIGLNGNAALQTGGSVDQVAHDDYIMVFDWWVLVAVALLCAIVAQTGDFFESWMKRRAGVKDSGALIPGHGGLFDRTDGLLAVCFVLGVVMLMRSLL